MGGVYKRGRIYWARAQRDGVEYRVSLETTDRRVAHRGYLKWLAQLDKPAELTDGKPRRTFTEAAEKFIAEHCTTIRPASAKRYGVSLKALSDSFEGLHLDEITREKLAEFETARRTTPIAHKGKATRLPSAPTIRRDLACLSSLLTSCEDWGWINEGDNPVRGFMKRRAKRGLKEAPPRTRYLTEAEEVLLLAAASPEVRRAIIVAIDTGLRMEEQFSLMWAQVDFDRGVIVTADYGAGADRSTKSGRSRMVPLPERSAALLRAIVPSRRDIPSPYVFKHENGERLLNMKKGLAGAVRRAKLKDVHWHDLRRTAGCRWLQRDKRTLQEVRDLLGHSTVKVTETTYGFLDKELTATSVAAQSAGPKPAQKPAQEHRTYVAQRRESVT